MAVARSRPHCHSPSRTPVDPHPRRPFLADHPVRSADNIQSLTDEEIEQFLEDLDHDNDGHINYAEVEMKLDQAHDELFPKRGARLRKLPTQHDIEEAEDTANSLARHDFLHRMMGGRDAERIPRHEFAELVREWGIPSLNQAKKGDEEERSYLRRLPGWRKIRAYWAVHGPEIGFIGLVVSMQVAFGIWQLMKYLTTEKYRAGFGWGVVMAKTCAGAMYPTFFFLILSMSRYFSTLLRRSYHVSRFFNWDLSQEFHIRISCVAILLATLHAIGHLTGSFRHGSDPANQEGVANVLGGDVVPMHYADYIRTLPGITGITGLALMYTLSILSVPQLRRWNYEVFQLGHALMYPIIGLMMAHGTAGLFQWPMFGYFLAFPTLLVLVERAVRVDLGFIPIKASMKVLDEETVEITAAIPSERIWKYKAGQYVFLQVPEISLFQWHPFTVSFCRGNKMMLHIKTDGNWTGRLRALGGESGESEIEIGINGPFGAPAQRFYDFSHSIIIGAGIGVTPFSGILADLQHKDDLDHGGPAHKRRDPKALSGKSSDDAGESSGRGPLQLDENLDVSPDSIGEEENAHPRKADTPADDYRRVDFHWIVRDRNYLLWISDLLNEVSRSQEWHRENEGCPHLGIRINTHVTAKRKDIVTHIYRWLLEMHRTEEHPESPLTGLLNPTHFGRPDFDRILDEHYEEMVEFRAGRRRVTERGEKGDTSNDPGDGEDEKLKVGVFYCGAPVVGEVLADKCRELTTRGRHDGSKLEYHFMIEVFG
ncbi:related to NADPH oxidase homolog 1 [Cephalotrichum gorgonifer]|uniref:Related to NADPH oxidase homolog 1 n=1 Tax=Cephalotrichum gorgonifer TaxID=2041049 RepID=A0AAE8MVS4_9PEZI|nr:related to NADPH oxidase homolog 1 [Cephalotrichum gorgonifer]